jgi:hypothetical protein
MRLGADVGTLHEASNRPTGLMKIGSHGRTEQPTELVVAPLTHLNLWGGGFREPSAIALASRAIWAVSRIDYLGKGLVSMGTCE